MNTYKYLNDIKGSTRGLIGEILFKYNNGNVFCTKLCRFEVIEKLPFKIPDKIKEFLKNNWKSLDCFQFKTTRDEINHLKYINLILYEVKTKKYKTNQIKLYRKLSFTENEIKIYKQAQKLGSKVFIAKIFFFENWKYMIRLDDFIPEQYNYIICNGGNWFKKIN